MAEIVLTKEQAREFGVAVAKVIDGHDPDVLYEWYAKFNGPMWESLEEIKERMPAILRAVAAALDKGAPVQAPKPLVYCARKRSDMTPCVITDGDCARDDSGECVGCGRKNVIAGVSDPDDYPVAALDQTVEHNGRTLVACVGCGNGILPRWKHCPDCGADQTALGPPPLKVGDRVESDFIEGRVHDASPRIAVIPEPNFGDGLHYPRLADLRRVDEEKP